MPRVVITHAVVDVGNWLRAKAERAEVAAGLGASDVVDHVAHDGSNSVALTFETDDKLAVFQRLIGGDIE